MDYQGMRTYRRFHQEPVPEAVLGEMMENVRIASCAKNDQPLIYTVVRSAEMVKAMQPLVKWAAALPKELGTPVEGEQPTAFVVIAKSERAVPLSDIDVGIAVNTLAATAWEHKVGSCIMASINAPKIQELLAIPEGYKVRLVLALGYPSHKSTVVELKDSLDYYLDEERNYYVPKRALEDIVAYK